MQAEYTIDELARVADTTVRSVRVYHERGLLPSPTVRGRIGYYSAEHLNRLHTISRLLSRGMKLNGIRELLDAWDRGDGLADVLGVTSALAAPLPRTADSGDCPGSLDSYRPGAPHCADLTGRLIAAGLTRGAAAALLEQLRQDCDRIADRYAGELFYCLTALPRDSAERGPDARAMPDTDAARLAIIRAVTEFIDQGFARHARPTAAAHPAF